MTHVIQTLVMWEEPALWKRMSTSVNVLICGAAGTAAQVRALCVLPSKSDMTKIFTLSSDLNQIAIDQG